MQDLAPMEPKYSKTPQTTWQNVVKQAQNLVESLIDTQLSSYVPKTMYSTKKCKI